jgi:D-amino-acid dehydrogenase
LGNPRTSSSRRHSSAEIVVIGGGIVGAAAAYRLALKGVNVTIIDRSDDGYATAAGAGGVPGRLNASTVSAKARTSFTVAAAEYFTDVVLQLEDDGESDTGYETIGGLHVATNEQEQTQLAQQFDRDHAGADVTRLSATEAKRLFPLLREGAEGVHVESVARVDGRRLRDSVLRAVQRRGGTVIKGSAALLTTAGRVMAVKVGGERIPAGAVVAAAGAWNDELGVKLGIYPQRGQILHLEMRGIVTDRWPFLIRASHRYILPFPAGRVVAGATAEDDAGFDYRVTAAGQAKLIADALFLAPGLAAATVIETRVGFRPVSPDGLPVLGSVNEPDGLYIANGLGSGGLGMGPFVGAVAADLALGELPAVDISAFSPARSSLRRPVSPLGIRE